MSQIEQGQQFAQLLQQGLEQPGLLVVSSDNTKQPKTALANRRYGLDIRLAGPV